MFLEVTVFLVNRFTKAFFFSYFVNGMKNNPYVTGVRSIQTITPFPMVFHRKEILKKICLLDLLFPSSKVKSDCDCVFVGRNFLNYLRYHRLTNENKLICQLFNWKSDCSQLENSSISRQQLLLIRTHKHFLNFDFDRHKISTCSHCPAVPSCAYEHLQMQDSRYTGQY